MVLLLLLVVVGVVVLLLLLLLLLLLFSELLLLYWPLIFAKCTNCSPKWGAVVVFAVFVVVIVPAGVVAVVC